MPLQIWVVGGGVGDSGLLVVVTVNDGDSFVGLEGVCTVVVHHLRKAPHNGMGLTMEVSHHGIAMPSSYEPDVVHVLLAKEHCHCAAGT
jgi:hypothetical protein